MPSIEFADVRRTFGRRAALDGFDLAVEPGTVLGLVGRNGAGKTTALRVALGLLWPDAGCVRVLGLDPRTDAVALRTRVSLLGEEASLYPWMTVEEIVRFAAALHPRWDREHADALLKQLDLDPRAKIGTLSRGTRAKVALLIAVAPRPDVLLLDDPTAGLDPLVRREVLAAIIDAVPAEGGTVIYATHLVADLERVADELAYVERGRVSLRAGIEELKARVRRATFVFEGDAPAAVPGIAALDVERDGRRLELVTDEADAALHHAAAAAGAHVAAIAPLALEDILVARLRSKEA